MSSAFQPIVRQGKVIGQAKEILDFFIHRVQKPFDKPPVYLKNLGSDPSSRTVLTRTGT